MVVLDWFGKMLGLPREFLFCTKGGKGGGVIQSFASDCNFVVLLTSRFEMLKLLRSRFSSSRKASCCPSSSPTAPERFFFFFFRKVESALLDGEGVHDRHDEAAHPRDGRAVSSSRRHSQERHYGLQLLSNILRRTKTWASFRSLSGRHHVLLLL